MRLRTWAALGASAALLLAACGGDDDTDSGSSATTTEAEAATTEGPAATTEGTSATSAAPDDTGGASDTASTDAGTATTAAADVTTGGSVTILTQLDPASLSPSRVANIPSIDLLQATAIYGNLVTVDTEGTITPGLALSVTGNDDFTAWTIDLREGVLFQDGTPFDAEAIVYNWTLLQDPAAATATLMKGISSFTATDDLTVSVELVEPNSQFPRLLMSYIGWIGSPTAMKALGEGFGNAPVGAGPFAFKEWTRDDKMVLERYPDYWDAPKPYLDELVFRPVVDAGQRADTFLSEDGTIVFFSSPSPATARVEDGGTEVVSPDLWGGGALIFNTSTEPFDDVRLRQAVGLALDLDDLNAKAAAGQAQPYGSMFPESSPFYEADVLQGTNDLAAAQALVDEYLADSGAGSLDVNMTVNISQQAWAEAIQQQLSRLENVNVTMEVLQGNENLARMFAGDFAVITGAYNGVDPEPTFTRNFLSNMVANMARYNDPQLDAAIIAGRSTDDLDERAAAYKTAQEIMAEQLPILFLYRQRGMFYPSADVENFSIIDVGAIDVASLSRG